MTSTKTVVITGASSGIGRACALHLDRLGFQVFAGVRKAEDGQALQEQASARLQPLFLDVTDEASVSAAAETVAAAVGRAGLSGLVNNAGVFITGPLEFVPVAELRRQFEVNVIGQVAVIQAFLPLLRQGRGRIVNMSSMGGRVALPFAGPYSASKFALEALNEALRAELYPWGIEVCLIEPGVVATPIWDKPFAPGDPLLERLPPQAQTLYGSTLTAVAQVTRQFLKFATSPERVAAAVAQALTAAQPKTRYVVGLDARAASVLNWFIPARLRDRLVPR